MLPKCRKYLTRLIDRVGHRGAFLLFLAVLDIAYGYSLWFTAAPQRLWDLVLPWEWWAAAWIAVGIICAVNAFLAFDRIAFTAASALFTAWSAIMVYVWEFQDIPRGWVSAVVFGCFAITILIVSSWQESRRHD